MGCVPYAKDACVLVVLEVAVLKEAEAVVF